jgi:hypothetical protein
MVRLSLTLMAVALATGCTYNYPPPSPAKPAPAPVGPARPYKSNQSVLNNTPFALDVFVDGELIVKNLLTGQVCPIKFPFFAKKQCVAVTGHDEAGNYTGQATWIFLWDCPEVWTVNRLLPPQQ